jgi:hypothetical protein
MNRRPRPKRGTSLLIIAVLTVVTAVLLLIFVLRLAKQPGAKVNLGSPVFDVGKADVFAPDVARFGPLKFQALRGGADIFVQHLGPAPKRGWLAFETHSPDEPRTCVLQWQPRSHDFSDPCSHRTFPADGTGLTQYAVRVDSSGHVVVTLRQPIGTVPPANQ